MPAHAFDRQDKVNEDKFISSHNSRSPAGLFFCQSIKLRWRGNWRKFSGRIRAKGNERCEAVFGNMMNWRWPWGWWFGGDDRLVTQLHL